MIKRLIYGVLPYCVLRVFHPQSALLKYYQYIMWHGYARHLYLFEDEYADYEGGGEVCLDPQNGLYFVLLDGRRLYFKRGLSPVKIKGMFKALVMEQDVRSPHHYMEDITEVKDMAFVDVGCAEGFSSLKVVGEAKHIYLFESDEAWIEALKATFKPWEENVTITRKTVGDKNDGRSQTLDDFFKDKPHDKLFLKMDVEGAERYALKGCSKLFEKDSTLSFAICTYHLKDDEKVIRAFLDRHKCDYVNQQGFFRHKLRSVVLRGKKR